MSAAGSGDGLRRPPEWEPLPQREPPWQRSHGRRGIPPADGDDTAARGLAPLERSAGWAPRTDDALPGPTFTPVNRDRTAGPVNGSLAAGGPGPDGEAAVAAGSGADDRRSADADAGRRRAPGAHRAKPPARRRLRLRPRNILVEFVALAAIALTLTLVIKSYVVQAFFIPSGSMQNTLAIGDRVLVNKMVYDFRGIHRGDIVVFDGAGTWNPGDPGRPQDIFVRLWDDLVGVFGVGQGDIYVKRVIGLPGDRVACCNASGQITVNGVPLNESSYLYPGDQSGSGDVRPYSVIVPPGSLWLLGDHRSISFDSRGHAGDPGGGAIPESAVLGRAFVIIWPPGQWNILNIPATFQQPRLNATAAAPAGSSAAEIVALDRGVPLRQAWTPVPLALGFAGALPLAWVQRRARRRLAGRLWRRRGSAGTGGGDVLHGGKGQPRVAAQCRRQSSRS